MTLLEQLISEDYGLEVNGTNWARAEAHNSLVIDRAKQIYYWNSRGLVGDA